MSDIQFNAIQSMFKVLGTKNALGIYNRFATDERKPLIMYVTPTVSSDVKIPPFYDVSHWKIINDWYNLNPHPMMMGTKATQGTSYRDPTFVEYFTKMKDIVKCARLAYHFFEKTMDAVRQANWFLDYIEPYLVNEDFLCLDFEQGGETASQLWAFLDRLHQRRPNNPQMIYSRKNLMDPIAMTNSEKEYFKKILTWPAGYPSDASEYTTIPSMYIPDQTKWGKPGAWQYTDSGHVEGIDGDTDCNLMEQVLIDIVDGNEPEPPPDGGTMKYGKVLVELNIRRQPNSSNTTNPPIGTLKPNDVVRSGYQTNGWWRLDAIFRANVAIALPAAECYSYEGSTQGYIQEIPEPVIPSGAPKSALIEDDQGKTWRATSFTEYGP